jgi:hypothetical protein
MSLNSIVGIAVEPGPRQALGSTGPHLARFANIDYAEAHRKPRQYTIRAANSEGQRSSASILVNRMYGWRGYQTSGLPEESDDRITLVATDHDKTIGTITIGFDGGEGLFIDDLFREEADELRQQGVKVCEFIKLAIDKVVHSKRVLASLFHVAFIYAHEVKGFDKILIEVNPRHVRFYQRMLGFEVLASARMNRRVDAPAVLLGLDLEYVHRRISAVDGVDGPVLGPAAQGNERSLYPYCFSAHEEAGIAVRLRTAENA